MQLNLLNRHRRFIKMALNKIFHTGILCVIIFSEINVLSGYPIDVVYTGNGCHCEKTLPYEVMIPVKLPKNIPIEKKHGYRVEVPVVQKSKIEYTLDFEVEKPLPLPKIKPLPAKDLFARVDRIALSTPDCPRYPELSSAPWNVNPHYPGNNNEDCCGGPKYRVGVHYPRYSFNYLEIDNFNTDSNRKKREINKKRREKKVLSALTYKKYPFERKQMQEQFKSISKRSIKDEKVPNENLLNEEQSKNPDLQIPEILQYMPEVSSPKFERGKCFACQQKSRTPEEMMRYDGRSYVNQFQCEPKVTPVYVNIPKIHYHHVPNTFQPKPNTDDHYNEERYVYDRLGHKYKQNKGSLKLVPPTNQQEKQNEPILGKSKSYSDPNMDHLIKKIVSNHQDFIQASDHGEGVLTPSAESQRHDIDVFLRRLVKDKIANWLSHRHTQVYEDSHSDEDDDSFERVQRSLEETYDFVPVSDTKNDKHLLKLVPKQKKYFKNIDNGTNELHKIKSNHIVKFRKNGKVLQLLTSPETKNEENEKVKDKSVEQSSTTPTKS